MTKDKSKEKPKGPGLYVVFTSVKVETTKVEVTAKIFNSSSERHLRFSINDAYSDSKETKDREAEHVFTVPTNTISATIKVAVIGANIFDVLTLDLPQLAKAAEKKKDGPRLEIMTVRHTEDSICAILARLNPEGQAASGRICYIDEEARIENVDTESTGIATITFPKRDKERRAWLFLPENIGNKTPLNISAIDSRNESGVNTKNNDLNGSFTDKWKTGFTAGRDFYKSLKTKKEGRT